MPLQLTHHQSETDLLQARRCLMDAGDVPPGLVDDTLRQSWLRSRHAGLSPVDVASEPPLCTPADLRQTLASEHDLLAHARPVMSFVFDQIRDSGNVVVLADNHGLLLDTLGDIDFATRAERVSLRPGALWHEHDRGTNAIGTALAEERAVVIHGAEHYLARNSFLTCAAAPVLTSEGRLRGVIDISGDHRGQHPHTFALVRSAARMIEDRLFHARHGHDQVLRLHAHAEGLGAVGEGLVALSDDGWVVGSNQLAREWLGLPAMGGGTLADLTGLRVAQMPPGRTLRVRAARGLSLFARLDWPRRPAIHTPSPSIAHTARPASPPDAAAPPRTASHASQHHERTLDTRLAEAHHRAQRVQAQGIPVLIQGESGTGKEVFARALHQEGPRAARPFVALNCAALPETLIEAELFGYVGGAFTGARREGAPGRIREADGGTLFLDEIGDMPLALQARLLRVLQDKMVVPLGGNKAHPVDFVLVCATHRNLREAVRTGQFREDLFYRLNGLTVTLPALRERQDFDTLVAHMLADICQSMGRTAAPVPQLHPGLHQALAAHHWPGNLRQLHSLLRTACALLEPREVAIDWRHVPDDMQQELQDATRDARRHADTHNASHGPHRASGQLESDLGASASSLQVPNLRRLSQQTIQQVIAATQGNMSEAARRLGISRNTLYRRLKRSPE
ncbi:sigma-54-dependent Fis family transcriptional regulator [Aquabacterium sp. G14]|uniref:sigma-54-dependent Fis family transcriptional regulator n=1 Tax=Aquabacterium sp. G14 TaxID=3130164 RepID=UPI0030A2316F